MQRNILFSLLPVANQPRTIAAAASHIFRFCVSFRYDPKSAMDADLQEAIDCTRVFPDIDDPEERVQVETGLPQEILNGLETRAKDTVLVWILKDFAFVKENAVFELNDSWSIMVELN